MFRLSIIFSVLFLTSVSGDYYSAISELEKLLDVEAFIVEKLDEYLERAQQEQDNIKRFLGHIDELQNDRGDLEEYFGNPLNSLITIRRLVHDWKFNVFDPIFKTSNFDTYKSSLSDSLEKIKFKGPTQEDLQGATSGLLRLQKIYQLPTDQLAKGVLPGEKNQLNTSLSASDCFELGKNLCQIKEYSYGSEWLLEATKRLHGEPLDFISPNVSDVQILEQLSPAFNGLGNVKLAHKLNNEILDKESDHEEALKNKILFESKLAKERILGPTKPVDLNQMTEKEQKESFQLYKRVCQGELHQSPREQRSLKCWRSHQEVPYYTISPFKIEQLSLDPYVAYVHEVLMDSEMEMIMDHGKGHMERSKVGQSVNSTTTEIRTSQNTWLWYEANPWLSKIKQRLEDVTGLSTESAEPLQLVNYGIGGQYEPHFDFMDDDGHAVFGWKGNRLLTALFYINDVALGGATAFPFLRLAVPPVKGSLLIWYNLHRSTHKDYRTRHAGCPVLKGSKWICNEWFHVGAQEFRRPCGLNSDEGKFLDLKEK
ncbi:prolyl 4-hydroxylase subunit alpha-1-like [Drosophila subpulchrella]|uniref:prolyl 4-hydroxylase subunit alpha-1-like n=1 Tax=Drosophila subpulchrella TaxID=1486046 RepID=UPI0018A14D0C|nr:prolyl 4-hydroxylase subunit alpha-1-like [Drosophila subpulchrella]